MIRKHLLRGYILAILTHTTDWDTGRKGFTEIEHFFALLSNQNGQNINILCVIDRKEAFVRFEYVLVSTRVRYN